MLLQRRQIPSLNLSSKPHPVSCKLAENSPRIHILGVAYKRDIDDVRKSPALDIILLLQRRGAIVSFSDPYVHSLRSHDVVLDSQDLMESVRAADCAVIVTDHSNIDYKAVVEHSKIVVDTRNALKGVQSPKIVRL